MKMRLYLNDYSLCADIDWTGTILPNKGDIILLQEFINLKKEKTNVLHFSYIPVTCNVVKVYEGYHMTRKEVLAIKQMKEVIVATSPIWRMINGYLTPCFRVDHINEHDIIDAHFPNEQID